MSLLQELKLRPPKTRAATDKSAIADAQARLAGFVADVKSLIGDQHPAGTELRTLAQSAGADAKAGLWDEVMKKVELGKKKVEAARKSVEQALKPVKDAKKVVDQDFGSDTPTDSAVDPGAAEQSLKDFADDVKSTSAKLKKAQSLLSKVKGESDTAKALGKTADALGDVAKGLDKASKHADQALAVAAAARKLEECRRVLARVDAVDFTDQSRRVENAKAMGDLAKLFGELGADATKEVPALKGYFEFVSRAGEIWVPIAKMTDRRVKEWEDAADGREKPAPQPEAKSIAADTSRVIAFEQIPDFIEEMWAIFDRSGETRDARRVRDLAGDYREQHDKLVELREKARGLKAQALHEFAELTSLELPGEKFLQQDLARHWTAAHDIAVTLRDEMERWNWIGVTFIPMVRALEAIRPKKA